MSVRVELDGPIDLVRTLGFARMGSGDPCLRLVGDAVWRATRTPVGLATQRLQRVGRDAVAVDVWGPGADWGVKPRARGRGGRWAPKRPGRLEKR